jgi:hypothetical protein
MLNISSKQLIALSGRFLMKIEEIESNPEAGDLLKLIAFSSSISKKGFVRMWFSTWTLVLVH